MRDRGNIDENGFTLSILKRVMPSLIQRVEKLEKEYETFEQFKRRLILLLLDMKTREAEDWILWREGLSKDDDYLPPRDKEKK